MDTSLQNKIKEAWNKTDWGVILKNMAGIDIPFDDSWKAIAVDVSGGADSALLLYLLASHISKNNLDIKIHTISHVRMWRTRPWQGYYKNRILDTFRIMFPTINFQRHENFIPPEIEMGSIGCIIPVRGEMKSGDQIESGMYSRYVCKTNKIDASFGSTTANPRSLHKAGGAPDRDVDYSTMTELPLHRMVDPISMATFTNKVPVLFEPFTFLEKDVLLSKYKELGVVDLFELTRSCEGESTELMDSALEDAKKGLMEKPLQNYMHDAVNQYTYGQYVPICGKCYWCKERSWAITKSKIYE